MNDCIFCKIITGDSPGQVLYRIIVNTGLNAGQVVFHLHLHLIGGQRMRFPLG